MWRELPSARIEHVGLLFLSACRFGGTSATAPEFDPQLSPAIREVDRPADASVMAPAADASVMMPLEDAEVVEKDAGCASNCDPEWIVPSDCTRVDRGTHTYLFCTTKLTWAEARSTCRGAGTDLVIIGDEAENAFVAANVKDPSWIGANDQGKEGSFVWIDPGADESGAAVSYTKWEPATPDNCLGGLIAQQDCVRISKSGSWNDSTCNGGCAESTFAFVCESY